jgi:hypothetical protein
MSTSPRILIVTGMHRSGTSLAAGLAAHGGVDMGAELMAAGKGNRNGHFEDLELVRFHEACLVARGAESLRPPEGGVESLSRNEERVARALLARRAGKRLWGWKDPRTTLFLPSWNHLLPGAFFLFVYRHPVEVALSLLRRGLDLAVQLDPRTAITAWTVYNRRLLAFRESCPERCLLWPIAAATADLDAAVEQLSRRSGLSLAGQGLASVYEPGHLHAGLRARGIEWRAVVPEAMELFGRLEAAADLPAAGPDGGSPGATRMEHELQDTSEHLLAAALGAAAGRASINLSREELVAFSDLRQQIERQQARLDQMGWMIARLSGERAPAGPASGEPEAGGMADLARHLEAQRGERARIEATRAWRLVNGYWRTARRIAGWKRQTGWRLGRLLGVMAPPRPDEILVGCVAENGSPESLAGARRLVRSLRWFGGSLAEARVLVCVAGGIAPAERAALERAGAEVRIVGRFDRRNPKANKLQFFPEALASDARGLLLLDCDTVVVADPLPLLAGGALQAKIADVQSVTHDVFVRLFSHFGLALPRRRYRTTLLAERTIVYCNSGVVFLPSDLAREIAPVWREWNSRLLDSPELLGPCIHHVNQASLTLALAAHPVPFAAAPAALNFPLHMSHLPRPASMLGADPVILHYHDEIDSTGCLRASLYPRVQARIEAFNRRWTAELAAER